MWYRPKEDNKEDRFVTTVVVNPKSMTIKQLFGYFDDGNEWKDGILATALRTFSNMNFQGTENNVYNCATLC